MGIDGLIILDNAGRSIIQSGFRSTTPAYPLLQIDAVNTALAAASRPTDVDPVIQVQHPSNSDIPSACCHVVCGDLRILCPISGNVDPLVGFAFLQTFVDILQEYFGGVSLAIVKDNFDVVYQLLEETLDSVGHPLTTSHNALRDIVLPPSLFSKLLNAATANLAAIGGGTPIQGPPAGPFSSQIPWRKAGVKYASNEMYIDVNENLQAIVNKQGVPLTSSAYGKIEVACRLSGTPDCTLNFTNPQVMTDCSFHPCVRLQRWSRDKHMSFIPPDGHFVLAEYRYTPNANSNSAIARFANPSSTAPSPKEVVPIPFAIKAKFEVEETTASFNLTFSSRLTTRPIENVFVELNLGESAHAIKCVASRESGGLGRGLSALESGHAGSASASWSFDSRKKVLRWEIPNVPPSTHWSLQGSFAASTTPPRPSHALQVRFEIQSHTFSALKVDQLKITGEGYKPYKGVRGRSTGNVEWRW
ncbi:mu-adaptin 3 [Ephemerocybe angulata]|uniref:Mu-adaptin 3 n=1 Tax=Ephemerocybe angulata TaxID=980116 RepID=A0A8H6ICA9_9AGAR|nr:mu-adaptin 3 [Tulosesus angulatus]